MHCLKTTGKGTETSRKNQYLHIFSKVHLLDRLGSSCNTYFYASSKKEQKPEWSLMGYETHIVKKLPKYCAGQLPTEDDGYVGRIKHTFSTQEKLPIAVSKHYYPLGKQYDYRTHNDRVGGKSHLLEIYSLNNAERFLGVTHASTCKDDGYSVSGARKYQLKRVGNPIGEPYPIREWKINLAKRINEAVGLFQEKQLTEVLAL